MLQIKVVIYYLLDLVHPIITKTNVNITKEAIVIPDTGRLDVPIVPVKRPATMTNNNDNINETIAAYYCHCNTLRYKETCYKCYYNTS